MSRPSLSESMSTEKFYNPRKSPENLNNRKRMMYEIEKLLMKDLEFQLDYIDTRHSRTRNIGNKDIYKIYKALCKRLNVKPAFVYTKNDLINLEEAKQLVSDHDKTLEDLEPTL